MSQRQIQRPVLVIQELISDFKTLPTWKKILYFLPLGLMIIAIGVYLFLNKKDDFATVVIDAHKEQIDNQLTDIAAEKQKIIIQERAADQEIKQAQQKIKGNESKANSINDRIDNATNFDELERIRKELGSR